MCGIAGFIDFNGHNREAARFRIKRMADSIAHRGPDGEGFYVDEYAALGHRRLAIIDVESGHQPMGVLDGQVQIVFNGEIYNFLEIRHQLECIGHQFLTRSDTEVILASYLEWGEHCVDHLNGMFAFAVWDRRARSLFLARDRVGKKPLYFYRSGTSLAFASELKAMRAAELCPEGVDPEALDCYFSFGYIPAPRTIYKGVSKLKAAHSLRVTAEGQEQRQYWSLHFDQQSQRPIEDVADELASLLDEAVRQRLMSEVPLGAFLSGGLDSSLVVATMARLMTVPVKTNSIGFADKHFSELPLAREIAEFLKTSHVEFVVQPQIEDIIGKIAWHFDEPIADSSAVPTWYVCELARRSVTVALSGDGGDEAFGGYTFRYLPHRAEARIRKKLPVPFRRSLFGGLGAIWPGSARLPRPLRLKSIFENLATSDAEAFYHDLIWLREDSRARLYAPDFMESLKGFTPFETVQAYYTKSDATDALGRALHTDAQFYMTEDVLAKVDRMSMAHSLEVRCPILDHRILEFAATVPSDLKMDSSRGKLPLRELAKRHLPANILNAPKRGFAIPAARWLRNELRPLAEELIFDRSGVLGFCFERASIEGLWAEHQSESRDHNVLLWGAMMLGLWERTSGDMAP